MSSYASVTAAWMGKGVGLGRMGTCVCMVELLWCPPETITMWFIGYTPIQNKKLKKKKNNQKTSVAEDSNHVLMPLGVTVKVFYQETTLRRREVKET